MQQPDAHTMDYVFAIIAVAALAIGLISMLVGRAVEAWDRLKAWRAIVNHSQALASPAQPQTEQTAQTDGADRRADGTASGHDQLWRDFLLDRTRARLIAVMVDSQLSVAEIRGLLKGDNGAIGNEAEAARTRLGLTPPEAYRTPIAGRPTNAAFYEADPELAYQPPPN